MTTMFATRTEISTVRNVLSQMMMDSVFSGLSFNFTLFPTPAQKKDSQLHNTGVKIPNIAISIQRVQKQFEVQF